MPQEEICRNRIISENYRDFIVNQLRGNIFDSISSEELCEQSMEYLYKTIYVDGTMADPINFEKYTYNSVPKCFTLIDTEALSQSGNLTDTELSHIGTERKWSAGRIYRYRN